MKHKLELDLNSFDCMDQSTWPKDKECVVTFRWVSRGFSEGPLITGGNAVYEFIDDEETSISIDEEGSLTPPEGFYLHCYIASDHGEDLVGDFLWCSYEYYTEVLENLLGEI